MNILFLTSQYPPSVGGAETYAAAVVRGLRALGHRVLVIADGNEPEPDLSSDVFRTFDYAAQLADPDVVNWEVLQFGLHAQIIRALEVHKFSIDVVFTNSLDAALLGRVVASHFDVPLLSTFHEHAPQDDPLGRGKIIAAYAYAAPNTVIAGSQFYLERATTYQGEGQRTRLITHGVDTLQFSPDPADRVAVRQELGIDSETVLVLVPGRFKPRKNQILAIRALGEVNRQSQADWVVLFAGSTSSGSSEYLEAMRREISEQGISDRALFREDIPASSIHRLYKAADVTLVPTHEEGLGLVALEAMSAGNAVVMSPVAGIKEILRSRSDIALLPSHDHLEEWATAARSAIESETLRQRIGHKARLHVINNFSENVMLEALEHELVRLHHD